MGEMWNVVKEIVTGRESEEVLKRKSKKKDLNGWLYLFAFGLYLGTFQLLGAILDLGINFLGFVIFLYLILSIYTIILMHGRKKKFKIMSTICLWTWIPVIIIMATYFSFTLDPQQFSEWKSIMFEDNGILFIGIFIGSTIWSNYLLCSKKVRKICNKE